MVPPPQFQFMLKQAVGVNILEPTRLAQLEDIHNQVIARAGYTEQQWLEGVHLYQY
jgi:hypothetical protein